MHIIQKNRPLFGDFFIQFCLTTLQFGDTIKHIGKGKSQTPGRLNIMTVSEFLDKLDINTTTAIVVHEFDDIIKN